MSITYIANGDGLVAMTCFHFSLTSKHGKGLVAQSVISPFTHLTAVLCQHVKVLHKYTYLLAMYTESLMQALIIDSKLLTRNEMENEMKRNCGANKKAGWHTVSLVC